MFSFGPKERHAVEFIIYEVNKIFYWRSTPSRFEYEPFKIAIEQKGNTMFSRKGNALIDQFRFNREIIEYIEARFDRLEGLASPMIYTYLIFQGIMLRSSYDFNISFWNYCEQRITAFSYGHYRLYNEIEQASHNSNLYSSDEYTIMDKMSIVIRKAGNRYITDNDMLYECILLINGDSDLSDYSKQRIKPFLESLRKNEY